MSAAFRDQSLHKHVESLRRQAKERRQPGHSHRFTLNLIAVEMGYCDWQGYIQNLRKYDTPPPDVTQEGASKRKTAPIHS